MSASHPRHPRFITRYLIFLIINASLAMAITVFPSDAEPQAYNHDNLPQAVLSTQDLFKESCPIEYKNNKNATVVFSSSFNGISDGTLYPTSDGFVRGAIDAWAQHQHLVIRPDEVWFSILVQMNFYMNENAEELRHLFVSHSGKNEIHIEDVTMERILSRFGDEIQARVKTPWLQEWITPNFSTTTDEDRLAANVLVMGLMKSYYHFSGGIICGLPSVTLLGEKADWQQLLAKLDRLSDFGEQPKAYASQLRPILSHFVQTFDEPDSPRIREFWNNIVLASYHDICGVEPYTVNGWLTGFAFWDREGKPLSQWKHDGLDLDGVKYTSRKIDELPIAYAQVPLTMVKFHGVDKFLAYLVAGNIAKQIRHGLPAGYAGALKRFNGSAVDESLPHSVLEPRSGWLMYGPTVHTEELSGGDFEFRHLRTVLGRSGLEHEVIESDEVYLEFDGEILRL
jgi:hypothetical protein